MWHRCVSPPRLSHGVRRLGERMQRRTVFLVLVGAFLLSSWTSGGGIGVSSVCENTECLVAASASALSVVIAVGLALFVVLYPQTQAVFDFSRAVGIWRRFGAFVLDFALVLMVVSPLAALPILIAEGGYSGTFEWSFQRDFVRPTDGAYLMSGVVAGVLALFYYFYQHVRVGRPTVGQYVLGYRVIKAIGGDREPRYAMSVLTSFIGLCVWPVSVVLALCHPQKAFWWDSATGTAVVRV
jgi:RDD family